MFCYCHRDGLSSTEDVREPPVRVSVVSCVLASGWDSVEIINGRFNYRGRPITICFELAAIDHKGLKKPGSEADDVTPKEAGGFACFQKIQNCCEEHGIAMFRTSENGGDESVLDENGQVRRKALVLVGGDLRILRRSVVVVLLA